MRGGHFLPWSSVRCIERNIRKHISFAFPFSIAEKQNSTCNHIHYPATSRADIFVITVVSGKSALYCHNGTDKNIQSGRILGHAFDLWKRSKKQKNWKCKGDLLRLSCAIVFQTPRKISFQDLYFWGKQWGNSILRQIVVVSSTQ